MDQNEIPHDPRHLIVLSSVSKMIFEPVVCSAQNHAHDPHLVGVRSGAFKIISVPTIRLAQIVHLSQTDTNTISKRNEMRFHMTLVT
jgi:hypothetical protein